jgi:hypothetical protein
MGFPHLDVVLGLTAGRVDFLVEMLAAPAVEIGHDVAGITVSRTDCDTGHEGAAALDLPLEA